jgi:tripartite-type tricarboxylate transporter receptor subunit TctC
VPIVVYRGTAPAVNDIAGGHAPMMIEAIFTLLPTMRRARARGDEAQRGTLAPDIPTAAEVGLPQLAFGALCSAGPFHLLGEVH